jgi:hypothetical protein
MNRGLTVFYGTKYCRMSYDQQCSRIICRPPKQPHTMYVSLYSIKRSLLALVLIGVTQSVLVTDYGLENPQSGRFDSEEEIYLPATSEPIIQKWVGLPRVSVIISCYYL